MFDPNWIAIGAAGWAAVMATGAAWAARQRPAPPPQVLANPPRPPIDVNAVLDTLVVKSMDGQIKMLETVNGLNLENAKLAAEVMQRNTSRLGGKNRAKRAGRNEKGAFVRDCPLCKDPNAGGITVAQIMFHSQHKDLPMSERTRVKQREEPSGGFQVLPDRVQAFANQSEVVTDAQGNERIECPDCQPPTGSGVLQ